MNEERQAAIVNWLAGSKLAHQLRTSGEGKEGFFVLKGTRARLQDGSVVEVLDWLKREGIIAGKSIDGCSILYTAPETGFKEKLTFFRAVYDAPFPPRSEPSGDNFDGAVDSRSGSLTEIGYDLEVQTESSEDGQRERGRSFGTFRDAAAFARATAIALNETVSVTWGEDEWVVLVPRSTRAVEISDDEDEYADDSFDNTEQGPDEDIPYNPNSDEDWHYEKRRHERLRNAYNFEKAVEFVYGKSDPEEEYWDWQTSANTELEDIWAEISAESDQYNERAARSEEDGWFYEDDD